MTQPELLHQLRRVLESHDGIQLAILFGSVAKGTARADSDIDLAILTDQPLTTATRTLLIEQIADATGRPVDLIDLRTAGEPLLGEVFKGRRLLGSDEAYARLLTRHLIDAADFGPVTRNRKLSHFSAWRAIEI